MAATKFYLDTRRPKKDGTCALKVNINKDSSTSPIDTKVRLRPEHWDAKTSRIIVRPDKTILNSHINRMKQDIDEHLVEFLRSGKGRDWSAVELKQHIEEKLFPTDPQSEGDTSNFSFIYKEFTNIHVGRTKQIYEQTYVSLQKYLGEKLKHLHFDDISRIWLEKFDNFLAKTSPSKNARNIHLRNIRAVFNFAIDNQFTTNYPFRKFSIKNEPTVKRSLTVEQLRTLFTYPCEDWQQQYVDIYKLIFFLRGINIIDLFNLKDIVNGRVEYKRAKTHKIYSIKVEPEAMEIIKKYKGKTALLNMADRYKNYRDYAKRLNNTVMHIGEYKRVGRGGKKVYTPLFPNITTYWMRHSWATIAAKLDIPKETIAEGLGHGLGNQTTSIYINFEDKKVDEANRKVIDYVLYNK